MATTTYGTSADNNYAFYSAPLGSFVLDGLGGVDTLDFGTTKRSDYTLVLYADGGVHVDSVSGASAALHGVLYNMEILYFDSKRDTLDLRTYFPTTVNGTAAADTLVGGPSGDTINGLGGNDTLTGAGGNDTLDGGAGADTAVFSGSVSQYTVSVNASAGSATVVDKTSGRDGSDTLKNIERLKFSDGCIALDMAVNQSGGETALLIGAVLGRPLMLAKGPLLGAVIDFFDQGYSLAVLAGALMRLPIWSTPTGVAAPSNIDIAKYLLTVTAGHGPDAATLASAAQALASETAATQGQYLASLALSSDNQAQVGLVGLQSAGMPYQTG